MVASDRFELSHATVKVWCLTAWLRGNFCTDSMYHLRMVEGDGVEPSNPKEQIYSLPRLATSLPFHKNGAGNRT